MTDGPRGGLKPYREFGYATWGPAWFALFETRPHAGAREVVLCLLSDITLGLKLHNQGFVPLIKLLALLRTAVDGVRE